MSLNWKVEGDGSQGLVLVHELGGTLHSFDPLVPLLAERFQVLRYDQRGCGASPAAPGPGLFGIGEQADDLDALARQADLATPYWILGVAAGAAVALEQALRRPRQVAGLILCGPSLSVDADRHAYLEARSARAVASGLGAVVDTTLERSYPPAGRSDRAAFETYRERFLANDAAAYANANRALIAYRGACALETLDLPCLVMAGTHDLLRPPSLVRAAGDRIRGSCQVEIDAGHLMTWQAPGAVAEAIFDFIDFVVVNA